MMQIGIQIEFIIVFASSIIIHATLHRSLIKIKLRLFQMMNKQRKPQQEGGGLPQLISNEFGGAAQSSGLPRSHKAQTDSSQSHQTGQVTMQQRISAAKPPATRHLNPSGDGGGVSLNQRLNAGAQAGRPYHPEVGISVSTGATANPEVRPATTKYQAARLMNPHGGIDQDSLPSVNQHMPRNRQKSQFQTADMLPGSVEGQLSQQYTLPTQTIQPPMTSQKQQQHRRSSKGGQVKLSEQLAAKKKQLRNVGATQNVTPQSTNSSVGQGLGSRFRVAVPMQYQNQQKSTVTQQRIASNSFWNQVSKNMNPPKMFTTSGSSRPAKEQRQHAAQQPQSGFQESNDPLQDHEATSNEMQKRIRQYQDTLTNKIKDSNNQTKPFSFLTNIGGKDTTQDGVTLRTGPGPNGAPALSAASALLISSAKGKRAIMKTTTMTGDGQSEKSSEQMAIFTDMNVDKMNHNARTMPKQRVVYLNSSASNKNLAGSAKQAGRMHNSKSGATLEPLGVSKHTASNKQLMQSASIDSFARRPVSGISKEESQSRFRQSQGQFGSASQMNEQHQRPTSEAGKLNPQFAYHNAQPTQNSARPESHAGQQQQLHSARYIDEYSEEAYLDYQNIDEVDDEQNITHDEAQASNFCQQLMDARPTTALVGSQEPEDQLPYPELFDRSERTFAATFAKYGDLSYFTPVQRIGTYMEYQARLKKRHLMDLIAYIKTSMCQIKLDDENDANLGMQNAQDFLDHCLFHGHMPEQDPPEDNQIAEPNSELPCITNGNQQLPDLKSYNPCSARVIVGFDFGKIWSDKLLKQIQISIYRMLHYIENPDSIRNDELSKYKKEWMKAALDLVPDYLLSTFPTEVKLLFHDVFQNYIFAMKQAIMEYILRSPDERKRLHILELPHPVLTAAERQARYGGYSIVDYQGTHARKTQAETEIKFRLITYNIVVSQLTNWWQEFRKFKLVDLQNLRQVVKERDIERDNQEGAQANPMMVTSPSMALDIDNFLGFQEAMLEKTVSIMKHIWHRGAILCIKKFKLLRSKQQQKELVTGNAAKSKWTYAGYQTYPTDFGFPFESASYDKLEKQFDQVKEFSYTGGKEPHTQMDTYQQYCLRTASVHQNVLHRFFRVEPSSQHDAVVDDYNEGTTLDDLIDIRESDAYIAFVSMVGGFTNYEENGYDILSKEYKRELKYAAGNLMRIQLRQMVDDSVKTLLNFFRGFKTFEQLKEKSPNFGPLRLHEQNPFNYVPIGLKQRKENEKKREQQEMQAKVTASDSNPINKRLAEQLKKRQTEEEKLSAVAQQRKMFSNAVTDQPKLNWPDFMDLQDLVNPIFRIELLLGTQFDKDEDPTHRRQNRLDECLEFNKSDEQILHSFEAYFEELVTCFNEFNRPEFCKIQEYGQKKYEVEQKELEVDRKVNLDYARENKRVNKNKITHNPELQEAIKRGVFKFKNTNIINPKALNFDRMMYSSKDFEAPYCYERYMGRIKVKDAPSDVVSKGLIDSESPVDIVFQKDIVHRSLAVATMGEEFFKINCRGIKKIIAEHLDEVKRVKELFHQFKPIYRSDMHIRVKTFINRSESSLELMPDYSTFLNELRKYRSLARELPERVAFPLFEVGTALVKEEIQSRINKYIVSILRKFEFDLKIRAKSICDNFSEIAEYYDKNLESAEDVVEMETYKNNLQLDMSVLQRNLASTRRCLFFLICQTDYNEILMENTAGDAGATDGECIKFVDDMLAWPQKLNDHCENCDERHTQERQMVEQEVFKKKKIFDADVRELQSDLEIVRDGVKQANLLHYGPIMDKVHAFQAKVDTLELKKQQITTEESLLHGYKSDFHHLQNVVRSFEPYYELWTRIDLMMSKKTEWAESKLSDIDADEVTQTIKESKKSLENLKKDFGSQDNTKSILTSLQKQISELESWRPTVDALCNKALKPRHWSKIKEVSGMSADEVNFETATLQNVIQLKVSEVLPRLAEISENAKKESRLEEMLKSMKREWEKMHFEITTFKDSQIPILQGSKVEEMQTKLDEDVLISQTIKNSPAVLPLLEEARQWERTMMFTQEIIEIWLKVQTSYLYLWPIFNSVGIQDEVKSLLDSDGFATVDNAWRRIMTELKGDTLSLHLNRIENLDQILKESNFQLENIQKNLNEYLEAKRIYFSRFFFLSNEDLIEILGESQKPRNIQKHLKKCFEGINKVKFRSDPNKELTQNKKDEISHIISKEDERIQLITPIYPHQYDGKVEEWLYDLEQSMCKSIQSVISDGLVDYPSMSIEEGIDHLSQSTSHLYNDRIRWFNSWPSQVILVVSQIMWTKQVEECLVSKNASSHSMLVRLHQQSQAQLNQIVNLVREKMKDLLRLTLSALIVTNVHARDLIETLARKHVSNLEDFEWICQMRYYYEEKNRTVDVKMITTELKYCNEFLGNTGRLVITQLTDRCYRTLMSALNLNLGGAPEGPAGTGKTETTKDLAKAIGVYCIVFNCADGLNAKAMAKFFKGLASGGSWSCFDEFNRIELEVLSVIAQQILEIQVGKTKNDGKFTFEGVQIRIKDTCNIFITMNPGYAGRSALPDNLKALFRPVAMMVPEYVAIAEISLYSYGFFESRTLAKKIVQTYRLCSEQLSTQYHYDYGMRAVKSVLTAAKNLKYEVTRKQSRYASKLGISQQDSSVIDAQSASVSGFNVTQYSAEESEEILILKSIMDVNLPKFLANDIPLFDGIIKDLFPDVQLPPTSYQELQKCAIKVLKHKKLQFPKQFKDKIIQLYDMIKCRHGLMIVGPANSGKTTIYQTLREAITKVAQHERNPLEEKEVESYVINPKSVTLSQLYGNYDSISQEFTDGVLGCIFRFCSYEKPNEKRRWIIFDGPVDANWIENMNTVLDDNKRLCLMNSEIIQMTDCMNMIFETHDLSKASPATISRCGMVYMAEDSYGGSESLLKTWLTQFSSDCNLAALQVVTPDFLPTRMTKLFKYIFQPLVEATRKYCQFILPASDNQITASMLRIMSIMCNQPAFKEKLHDPQIKADAITQRYDMVFQYAAMWSIGAIVEDTTLRTFFQKLREKISEIFKDDGKQFRIERTFQIPDGGLPPTNYYVDGMLWISWKDQLSRQEGRASLRTVGEDAEQREIIVPTTEILKQKHMLQMFADVSKPLLFVGNTGTGKTIAINQFLRSVNREKFDQLTICFSAKSSANFTQKQIEEKLEQRGRRCLGPNNGKKLIVFVDDMNMPAVEKEGAQPPIELLRQWMDHHQWYDYTDKKNAIRKIVDIVLVGAMCPPAGGKNPITPRFTRHFNIITCTSFDKQVMSRIYCRIIDVHIKRENIMGTDTAKTLKEVVDASIDVFQFAQANLRPTPAKSHYLFNLRDVSRIIGGIQLMKTFEHGSKQKLVRLWVHECGRVFADRLNDDKDVEKLFDQLYLSCRDYMKEDLYNCLKSIVPEKIIQDNMNFERDPIMMTQYLKFSDLCDGNSKAANRTYDEADYSQSQELTNNLNRSLENYNAVSQRPMDLVLFDYAVIHLLRICRILRMHKGNALLIGVGGSGRQSLSYLASFLMDQIIMQPEQSKNYAYENWAEDMKKLLYLAGCDLKKCTFLLTDNQLKASFMLEDVNNLINQYEIPGLFGPDDKILMSEKVRINAKKEGNINLYNNGSPEQVLDFFVQKVQQNLHIILAMSPTGQTLGDRIRNFPSLVNCCTLDWFHKWPVEALNAVAYKQLDDTPFDDLLKQRIVAACEVYHTESVELSKQFKRDTNRENYVTPTSFLDLMNVFQALLDKQRSYLYDKKLSYENGIQKLMQQQEEVIVMQQDINDKQPKLQEMEVSTEHLMEELRLKAEKEVEPMRVQIRAEEEIANGVAMEAETIKIDCETDLAKALPILQAAQAALNTIKAAHINEIRVLNYPPKHVKMVLHAVCVMCERKVERTPMKDNPKIQEDNWWLTAQKFMNEKDFLTQLVEYKKDDISDSIMRKIKTTFIDNPEFKPSRVAQASYAAKGLCEWIIKLEAYDKCVKYIKPKRAALKNAQESYQARMQELAAKQEDLKAVEMQFQQLQHRLQEEKNTQERLQNEIHMCKVKLERAKQLLSGLSGEKERWLVSLEELEQKLTTIVPDVLLSAALIAYMGAFTQNYRKQAEESWLFQMNSESLTTLDNFSLERVLGEPVQIRRWQMSGLPVDSFSVANGIMMQNGLKWPLMIDPQGQANRWIKNMEMQESQSSGTRLMILKPSDTENFVQRFEQALRMGLPMLLESVGEDLDPILDPVLLKQIFKVGGIKQIKFGDTNIDYADEFKLYMTTRYSNPHYLPEMTTKVQIINFMITFEGLSEQLLNLVVRKENMQLDEEHETLILSQYENQKKMRETEATILKVLKEAKGDILDDENAINILNSSQVLSEEIAKKQVEAEVTEQRLNQARQSYTPIADHSAMLFFLTSKLHLVDVMYQYSLSWFIQLFSQAVDKSRDTDSSEEEVHEGEDVEESMDGVAYSSAKKSENKSTAQKKKPKQKQGSTVVDVATGGKGLSIEAQSLRARVSVLINFFTQSLYSNVCRSIFEKDKLLFSFLLTAKIRESQGKLNSVQYVLLIETMTGLENPLGIENIFTSWLPNHIWNKLCTYASRDEFFNPLVRGFQKNEEGWKKLYECEILTDDMYPPNEQNISGKWSPFMKLLILKAIRPDKLGQAMLQYVHQEMGQEFLTPPIFDIEKSFGDSTPATPLIFILPGTDPLQQLNSFAEQKKKNLTMRSISLGQNQGPIAEKVIQDARQKGTWVLLQNCHLYPSWMPRLEQICEQMEMRAQGRGTESSHVGFRLWLTSYPSEVFPSTVLQSGIKMTNEPPIGLKSNMNGSYKTEPLSDASFFNSNSKSAEFKKIAFGLTMFHAILLQRCNYGPLGWNQNHQFTVSDLQISMKQLHYFIDKYENVPFNALKYLIGQCNYGGRVTESADQRVLMALLEDFLALKVLDPGYAYCEDETVGNNYLFPQGEDGYLDHIDRINSMPTEELPQIFGFHQNADISKNLNQAKNLTENLLQIGEIDGAKKKSRFEDEEGGNSDDGGKKKLNRVKTIKQRAIDEQIKPEDAIMDTICSDITSNLPYKPVDMDTVFVLFPVQRENSMNTVLTQELIRFNRLLNKILSTLEDLKAAQEGSILMTEQLSATRAQLIHGFVPDSWKEISYPSLKPLASYIRDLNLRIRTLEKWVHDQQQPEVFWLSGFFFTQSFLTAILQNYARKFHIEIDALSFEFIFQRQEDHTDHSQEIFNLQTAQSRGLRLEEPEDGALVSGLFFEGCRWDYDNQCLAEQHSKELYSSVPIIWLKPKEHRPTSPETLKTKVTIQDNHSVSTRRQGATAAAQTAFRKKHMRSEVIKQEGNQSVADTHVQYVEGQELARGADANNTRDGGEDAFSMEALAETCYECPLYKTTARYGTLLTTGHSTNFIIMVATPMPSQPVLSEDAISQKTKSAAERYSSNHWIKRGAAMVCSLSN